LTTPTPLSAYLKRHPKTRYLDAILCDLSCVMRGKRYPIGAAHQVFTGGVMLPVSSLMLSVTGDSLDPKGVGFSDGDPDETGIPVAGTLVPAPWAREPTAQTLLTLQGSDAKPCYFEPRNILAGVLARFAELGLRPVVAFEIEFYLVDGAHHGGRRIQPPLGPLSRQRAAATQVYSLDRVEDFSACLHAVCDACAQQGIATGAMTAEYAPGQFEINLRHSERPLEAADQCVMFRRVVQGVARRHGLQATFMAKPYPAHAGSGLHLHISLIDAAGDNVFAGDGPYGTPECASALLLHAIGGLKRAMAESMAIFAPNINSQRRFAPNHYVPVRPNWGFDNRSVAVRVPKDKQSQPGATSDRRIEHRVCSADANPYLALAAVLAGIHHGIENRLEAGRPVRGNAGAQAHRHIPFDVPGAVEKCRHGRILPAYFGQRYLDIYGACKLAEYRAFVESGQAEGAWYL